MPSYFLRTHKRGGAVRYKVVEKHVDGSQRVVESNLTKTAAAKLKRDKERQQKLEAELTMQAREGILGQSLTVNDLLDTTLEHLRKRASESWAHTANGYAKNHIRPIIGDIRAAALRKSDMNRLVESLIDKQRSPQTIRHCVNLVSRAWSHAEDVGLLRGMYDPTKRVKTPKRKKRRVEVLSWEQLLSVLPYFNDRALALAAVIQGGTGLRCGEVFALKREKVDLKERIVWVEESGERDETKSGDDRAVPFAVLVQPFVEEALVLGGEHLIPGGPRHLRRNLAARLRSAMRRAAADNVPGMAVDWTYKCRRKGCGHTQQVPAGGEKLRCPTCDFRLWPVCNTRAVTFRALRHSYATHLHALGADLKAIADILGHDEHVLKSHYLHLRAREQRDLVDGGHLRLAANDAVR